MKKWIMNTIYILAGITVGLTVVPALANTPLFSPPAVTVEFISEQEAIDIAKNYTDEIFQLVSIELDDDDDDMEYDVVLENDLKKVEVEVNAITGEVSDWDISWKRSNLPTSVISMEEAKAIALAYAGEGFAVVSIELDDDDDDDDLEYELVLVSDRFKVEVEIDARDGSITKWEAKGLDSTQNVTLFSIDEIKRLALEKAGSAFVIVSVELDDDDDDLEYEVKLSSADRYIEAEFDAITGALLEWEVELMSSGDSSQVSLDSSSQSSDSSNVNVEVVITREQAIAIARTRIGEAPILIKISLDYDDGKPEYDLEFKSGSIEYELEIDAISGDITEFEIED